jgi:O-antigen ligase
MAEVDFTGLLLALTILVVAPLGIVVGRYLTGRSEFGSFQYFPYALLLSVSVLFLFSGRNLSFGTGLEVESLAARWTTRLASLFFVGASVWTIARGDSWREGPGRPPYGLLVAFAAFWLTVVASPALLGADGSLSHDSFYPLLMGCAALLLTKRESDGVVVAARNGLLIFMALSVLVIPLNWDLVMDSSYSAGVLPGVPRFAGLAPHPVSMAALAQLGMLCLIARPISPRWLNRLGWALALGTLLLAQSKSSWVSFPVCATYMFWMRGDPATRRNTGLTTVFFVVVGLGATLLLTNLGSAPDPGAGRRELVELTTLTGRSRIWEVALGEWARHPVFGAGSNLFDAAYRSDIGMPYATDAHNQLIDVLARGGLVSAAGLTLYFIVLLVLSVKYAGATRGLSFAIFLAIALQSIVEVPLHIVGYGPNVLQHFLLLGIIAGQAKTTATSRTAKEEGSWGVRTASASVGARAS